MTRGEFPLQGDVFNQPSETNSFISLWYKSREKQQILTIEKQRSESLVVFVWKMIKSKNYQTSLQLSFCW